jgi:hypothetical protein
MFKSYLEDNALGSGFIQKSYSYFRMWADSADIMMNNKLTHILLERLRLYRQQILQKNRRNDELLNLELETSTIPFATLTSENYKKLGSDLWKIANAFLDRPDVERYEYYFNEKNILTPATFEANNKQFAEYLNDTNKQMSKYFKEQKSADFFHLRDCFLRYHLYFCYKTVVMSSKLIDGYNHIDGHLISSYLQRIEELPEIIYHGENIPEIITDSQTGGGNSDNFNVYRRNPYLQSSRNYYDKNGKGHYINNFNNIKRVDEILGFIFYKDDSIINKLILF